MRSLPASTESAPWKSVALWAACAGLALLFMAAGTALFLPPVGAAGHFARWGYPDWLRTVTGVFAVGGGLLLIVPRAAWLAAGVLELLLVGAAYTQLQSSTGITLLAALVLVGLLGAVAAVGFARRPQARAAARVRAVAEAFARREIAREQRRRARPAGRLPAAV
jgi:uncharacterized membrane protein YphA (DoxX/SURF4 family)